MRRLGLAGILAASTALSVLGGACGGGTAKPSPTDIPNRGGAIMLTHSKIASALPEESALAIGAFFAPPGPADSDAWPASGQCAVLEATPTPAESPSPTPTADFQDAGAIVTLVSPAISIDLDRFASADGSITYVSGAVDPSGLAAGDTFALTFPGGSGANALPPATLTGALVLPAAIDLLSPDFSGGALVLPKLPFTVRWDSSRDGDVELRLALAGTGGAATLLCTTHDDGAFAITQSMLNSLPSGTGQLSITRRTSTITDLTTSTVLVGTGRWVEGGVVTFP